MCGPDIPEPSPKPVPKAPPPAAKTAESIKSEGTKSRTQSASNGTNAPSGIDRLRVDLNVPDESGSGGFGSLLARMF
ncbi:hypothetical protein MHM88_11250 [Epibacterium sp. MM17-32]|uniref:hypothetical protein n=1 Tax=Epibacterium sp. MM17-32 TaxID=2917734 RepID=UPI001EF4C857|nr:hypothetical protein [Epibacterium sp. MM17-32]MCG7628384.1 hypothetical protein [Epibacterium sp. MM17-32]